MKSILILGASSSISKACAEIFAARGYLLFLAGRNLLELECLSKDLQIRFKTQVYYSYFDITAFVSHPDFFKKVLETIGSLYGVLMAVGSLDKKYPHTEIIAANFSGAVSILDICADYLASQKKGFIIGLSSVAGDRGRQSNYVYGASKAALTTYLQGLRNSLTSHQVHVLTVKLGLIDTKMTFGGSYPIFLAANPEKTGLKIIKALDKGKESVYIPKIWRIIMLIIRLIPEKIFKYIKI
ncbi:short-chain dehydrogenase/reductase SDR [Candidatus Rickettsiella viridis]|uniref:Short-chain dehydrogenase/reductase SDR n=1 Tax=Candidatus Rickettsiella viridis TaxID=676208 RepID=A0A2Z5UU26_9COXI|nr:SDR family NAD(P)-dependent oxidoreductase [Candidatus Rickettsiella viridis]BBB14555.1 short-chain dehydrogenase/reductase SDR [Candidatus Rickettsiella viridis]